MLKWQGKQRSIVGTWHVAFSEMKRLAHLPVLAVSDEDRKREDVLYLPGRVS